MRIHHKTTVILAVSLILISMSFLFIHTQRNPPATKITRPTQWETLFYSDFESETILDPPAGGTPSAEEWKWYPEGPGTFLWDDWKCVQVTTDVNHSGSRALKFFAIPKVEKRWGNRCAIAKGSGETKYWATPKTEYLQYYFYILPEFYDFLQEKHSPHSIFVDIEVFDGTHDRIGLIRFDIWGKMIRTGHLIHTPFGDIGGPETIAEGQFSLKPGTWYRVRLEVDHNQDRLVYFSLDGPELHYNKTMDYPVAKAGQLTPELKALGFFLGVMIDQKEGYAYRPMIVADDVEGGLEA